MRRLLLLSFLLFAVATTASAQRHTLRMENQSLPALDRNFYIEQVLDATPSRGIVGEVQKGLLNVKVLADFNLPLDQELHQFISRHHPQQENQKAVILRVKKLWVSEHTGMTSETGTAELYVDFLVKQEDDYHILYTASSRTTYTGLEVTRKHEANIAAALHDCLKEFASQDFVALLDTSEVMTKNELIATNNTTGTTRVFPVMQANVPAAGIYMTLDEFRNNSPFITTGYEIKQKGSSEFLPYLQNEAGKLKPLRNAWGFTYNATTYFNYDGIYYPLMRSGSNYMFSGPSLNNNTTAVTTGAILGGVVGGAIVAATAKPGTYLLNLETGAVYNEARQMGATIADARLILYRTSKGESAAPLYLKINGEDLVLQLNDFIDMDISTTNAGTSIMAAGDEANPINFTPAPNKTYYIACTLNDLAGTRKAVLTPVDKAKGEYDMKGIVFAQKKESKKKR